MYVCFAPPTFLLLPPVFDSLFVSALQVTSTVATHAATRYTPPLVSLPSASALRRALVGGRARSDRATKHWMRVVRHSVCVCVCVCVCVWSSFLFRCHWRLFLFASTTETQVRACRCSLRPRTSASRGWMTTSRGWMTTSRATSITSQWATPRVTQPRRSRYSSGSGFALPLLPSPPA